MRWVLRRGLSTCGAVLLILIGVAGCAGQPGSGADAMLGIVPAGPPSTHLGVAAALLPTGDRPAPPTLLDIPAISLSAPVEQLQMTATGDLGVPRKWRDVGWFAPGYRPGEAGHAVIVGHLDTDIASKPQAAFWNLRQLHPGDTVEVTRADRRSATFVVTSLASYPAGRVPLGTVFGASTEPMLELMTCAGMWRGKELGYSERLVVSARLEEVDQ